MKLLTKEPQELNENAKIFYIHKEQFKNKYLKHNKYRKVRDHYHYTGECRGPVHSIYNLKHSVTKKLPIAFHNGSNYHYYFIIKE